MSLRSVCLAMVVVCGSFGVATADDPVPPPAPAPTDTAPAPAPPPAPAPAPAPAPTDAAPAPAPAPALAPKPAPTTLVGRVTDVLGKPIPNARLYVLVGPGQRLQVETDNEGRYRVAVPSGALSVVIAVGRVHTYRQVLATDGKATTLDVEVEIDTETGGEVIRIIDHQLPAPAVPPKPLADQRISLPYSDEAKARDAWARAWLLLDVDPTGHVTRLKLLKRPGFNLDQIAIDQAFKLTFEPARDAAGRPVRTYIVWTMEWPSWGWLVTGNGIAAGKPNDYDVLRPSRSNDRGVFSNNGATELHPTGGGRPSIDEIAAARGDLVGRPFAQPLVVAPRHSLWSVPCAGSGPLNLDLRNRAYRDCSPPPDPERAAHLPWITRDNAATALAELARTQPRRIPRPRGSRKPELIATAITGALLVATILSYHQFDVYGTKVNAAVITFPDPDVRERDRDRYERYQKLTLGLAGGLVISGAVTAFLWSRGQTRDNFSVQPTGAGGTISYSGSF